MVRYIILFIVLSFCIFLSLRPAIRNYIHNRGAPRPLFVKSVGDGEKTIVLLHGLSGTGNYWTPLIDDLKKDYKVVVPDLLGFGHSPWPDINYTVKVHLRALKEVLPKTPFVLVGHSMGSQLAYELARQEPHLVKRLILLAPPSLSSRSELKSILKKESNVQSIMALDSWVAPVLCHIHESLGGLSFYFFRPFVKSFIPDMVVRSATLHRWESYNGSLENVVLKMPALNFDSEFKNMFFIAGSEDLYSKNDLLKSKFKNVRIVEGDHNFFWGNKKETIRVIRKILP